ncbi:ribosomal RNA processing protein 36 homolog [Mytilus edulis]|uniref:ribosomal RNA processing protein 36 homolog n=1 Tax=Mytilus edulis TaxID=6550 RepID=UPI0039EFC141
MSSTISVSKKRKSTLDTTASYSVNNAKKNKMSKLPKSPVDELHMMRKKEQVEESDTTSEESTVEESESEGSDAQEAEADELVTVKQELSNMSFEELIQLKERLGLKVYNQVVHGDKVKKPTSKRVFKRENKNRPMEMSSKRPVRLSKESDPAKKKMTRDPRFDDLSGEYNESYFKSNYSFLYDIKSREKEKIKKTMKKEKDPEKKVELKMLYNRMDQQEQSEKQKDKRKTLEKEWKKKEQSQVKEGKKPFFLKKTDLRKLELAEKYKELQKSGKLENYLSKKRKKTAQKEKKKLPLMT